ncbi:MAG: VWA domain-containing protein [Anaerolineae bacterium]|nr:VWA domain-containing protein [Anaerolineae bacterium]
MSAEYNLAAVRRLLLTAFTAEELPRFCRDRPALEPVCERFGPRQGLDDMVDELLEYARTRHLLGEMLTAVQEHNPRQYAAFAADLETGAGAGAIPIAGTGATRRAWVLLALLALDLGLLVLSFWFELGSRHLTAPLWAYFLVMGLLLAIIVVLLTVGWPLGWADLARVLGRKRHWAYVIGLLMAVCLYVAIDAYAGRPPAGPPTAYVELILDNGPVPAQHDFDELRAAVQAELEHALPNAALALRVFGSQCGDTRRLVDFRRGNAFEVADAAGGVEGVGQSDLTEAVRQGLDDLLRQRGSQPRVLLVVTWGSEGCGGDLGATLARYKQQFGSVVSLSLISLGEPPAMVSQPGVSVVEVDSVQEARGVLRAFNRVLESEGWSPRTPVFRASPEPTP